MSEMEKYDYTKINWQSLVSHLNDQAITHKAIADDIGVNHDTVRKWSSAVGRAPRRRSADMLVVMARKYLPEPKLRASGL